MKKFLANAVLKIFGWKVSVEGDVNNLNRCILTVMPHTSNWEYVLGNLAYWKLGKPLKIIIKDKHTKAWYGSVVKALGGIGIDRSRKNRLVEFVSELFEKEDFSLVITPEGTRSRVDKWRMGFYHIAMAAKVPIVLGGGDFKNKTVRIGKCISYQELTEKTQAQVLHEMQEYFNQITAKYPENWNPNVY